MKLCLRVKITKNLLGWIGTALLFLFVNSVSAQGYPTHTKLLYSSDLNQAGETSIGTVNNYAGSFVSGGWKATSETSMLRIALPQGLPAEGTMVVNVTNFNPVTQNSQEKHNIINLYSQGEGSKDIFETDGSWVDIRTGTNYTDGPNVAGFKMLAASRGIDTREEVRAMQSATWSLSRTYEFRIIWTESKIYTLVNGDLKATLDFTNQYEAFRYIFLGRDNIYKAMAGPVYKNVEIYTKDDGSSPSYQVSFSDITGSSDTEGYSASGYSHGAAFADVNQDGFYDLFVSNAVWDEAVPDMLYINQGDRSFDQENNARGTSDAGMTHSVVNADFDNDGDLDVYFANMPENDNSPRGRDALYRNDGNGYYTNITDWAGIATDQNRAKGAVAADFNNDGFLDIYINNAGHNNIMYFNDGTGKMQRVDRGANGPSGDTSTKQGTTVADIDNDGDVDIYACRRDAANWLFINDGNGNFTEEAAARGVNLGGRSKGSAFSDIDNDGDLDLIVMNEAENTNVLPYVRFYINQGNGHFVDNSLQYNIKASGYSTVLTDVDNDADIDMVVLRNDEKDTNAKPELYLNDGAGNFSIQSLTGVDVSTKDPRAGVFGDIDNDGDMDLYFTSANGEGFMLRNVTNSGYNYLDVLCIGPGGDYGGFGTKVYVYEQGFVNDASKLIGFQQSVSNTAYLSQNQTALHFGLGENSFVDVVVEFQNGKKSIHYNVPANQKIEVSPDDVVPTLMTITGNDQTGVAGAVLGDSIKVLVTDIDSDIVPGYPVKFVVKTGGGSLNGTSDTTVTVNTNLQGYAIVTWKMGTVAGVENSMEISVLNGEDHISNSPQTIRITPGPADPAILYRIAGDGQSAYFDQFLENEFKVKITDAFDNIIQGFAVSFSIISGEGKLGDALVTQTDVLTDALGMAAVKWQVGPVAGNQIMQAAAMFNGVQIQNSPCQFTAVGIEPEKQLVALSERLSTGTVNQALAEPIKVKLETYSHEPVTDFPVSFIALNGNSNFAGNDTLVVLTNSEGMAQAIATLDTVAGDTNNVFHVQAEGAVDSPQIFKASGLTDNPAVLEKISGDGQSDGQVGKNINEPYIVRVSDQFKNVIVGADVVYKVKVGDGNFAGLDSTVVKTDQNGNASAILTLGSEVRTNTVQVTVDGLATEFSTYANPGDPYYLRTVSGSPQQGLAGKRLPEPFVVSVTDSFLNPISSQQVEFEVTLGGGNIDGVQTVNKSTDEQGRTFVYLTLGTSGYDHQVTASSLFDGAHLSGSPVVFKATTGPGDADSLLYVNGDNQIAGINGPLPQPLQVKVADENGIPVPGHLVKFYAIRYPDGGFNGQASVEKYTNAEGIASATPTIGSRIDNGYYQFQASSKLDNFHLKNSPINFSIKSRTTTAAKMVYMSGDGETCIVRQNAGDSMRVKIFDADDQIVTGHPVEFEIVTGDSILNGISRRITVNSDKRGICAVTLKAGSKPGAVAVKASSDDGMVSLENSPIDFSLSVLPGPVSSLTSLIAARDTVVADGQDSSRVTITVKDIAGNLLSGKNVTLLSSGIDVNIIQPTDTTDSNGQVTGEIRSFNVGEAVIWARCDGQDFNPVSVYFIAGPPDIVIPINDVQLGLVDKVLSDSIGVQVYDNLGHPVIHNRVEFSVTEGGGEIVETQPVFTNDQGIASVHWKLGSPVGQQKASAAIEGYDQTVVFQAIANPPSSISVTVLSGHRQIGYINQTLPEPFSVLISDSTDKPVQGINVNFELTLGMGLGQGSFLTSLPAATNSEGIATVEFKAGTVTGLHRIRVSPQGFTISQDIDFYVLAEETLFLEKIPLSAQPVRPQTVVPCTLKVKDAFGRLLENEKVNFSVQSGGGQVQQAQPLTSNENGQVTVTWIVGNSGEQKLSAEPFEKAGDAVEFSVGIKNSVPVITTDIPGTLTVDAGDLVTYKIEATDGDNDPVTFGIRGLPAKATFDSTGSQIFSWIPTNEDAGNYQITFIAKDIFGAADSAKLKLTVNPVIINHRPVITAYGPQDTVDVSVNYDAMQLFYVTATDEDEDALSYTWTVNGQVAPHYESSWNTQFPSAMNYPENTIVKVVVSDGQLSTSMRWNLNLIQTSVELSLFQADFSANGDVEIQWQTNSEESNAGFYILRSERKDGIYEEITDQLISPNTSRKYNYVDEDVKAGQKYFYKLVDINKYGFETEHGPVSLDIPVPERVMLAQNYPNPFNPVTTIYFELPKNQHIELMIFNINGQIVKELVNYVYEAGIHELVWDATDMNNMHVPSGVYYYRLKTQDKVLTKKLLLLK